MSGSSAKNYHKNGDEFVVGGILNVIGTGKVQKDGVDVDLGGTPSVTSDDITDATTVGKSVLTAADAAAARTATGAVDAAGAVAAVAAKAQIAALTPIADPTTATAEDVANLLNSVIAALKA